MNQKRKTIVTREFVQILIIRTIGNFLIFSSLLFTARTFYPPVREEIKFYLEKKVEKQYVVATKDEAPSIERDFKVNAPKGGLSQLLNIKQLEVLVPVDTDFSVVIPKIGANAKVIPNVNAANETEYLDALKVGVAHTLGTAFPGEGGHIYLFAHSTDYFWNVGTYNAVFYLLYKLEPGDEVNMFYKGVRHTYRVREKKIVDPTEVEYLTRKTDHEELTLQTCWPPGTTLQRLLIFAEPVTK